MLLKCTATLGSDLGPHQRGEYYFPRTRFELTRERSYHAYGMAMINGGLMVLVEDDYNKPAWIPLQAFEVEDPALPPGWLFNYVPGVTLGGMPGEWVVEAIWGYPELVRSEEHYSELIELEPSALAIFKAQHVGPEGS